MNRICQFLEKMSTITVAIFWKTRATLLARKNTQLLQALQEKGFQANDLWFALQRVSEYIEAKEWERKGEWLMCRECHAEHHDVWGASPPAHAENCRIGNVMTLIKTAMRMDLRYRAEATIPSKG